MKIQIENTEQIISIQGVPARVWEGKTETGIKVICFITRIAVSEDETKEAQEQFKKELIETRKPTIKAVSYPLNIIL